MSLKIFLSELDSVRNSREESRIAQRKLFEELVLNGNIVVVTFNQITDSQWFMSILQNEEYYNYFMELFKKGFLKVSHYKNIRTLSHYVQNSLKKNLDNSKAIYHFSGIPIKEDEEYFLDEMRNALQYSDPERLAEDLHRIEKLISNSENGTDFATMVKEVYAEKTFQYQKLKPFERNACSYYIWVEDATTQGSIRKKFDDEINRLRFAYRYVKLILLISQEKTADNGPVENSTGFTDILQRIFGISGKDLPTADIAWSPIFYEATAEMRQIVMPEADKRSNWYSKIDELRKKGGEMAEDRYAIEELIIDICYNYTLESSIDGVKSLSDDGYENFLPDFISQIDKYYQEYKSGIHKLHCDREEMINDSPVLLDWKLAVDIKKDIQRFEIRAGKFLSKHVIGWKNKVWFTQVVIPILSSAVYAALFFVLNIFIDGLTDFFEWIPFIRELVRQDGMAGLLGLAGMAVIETFLFGIISSLLARRFDIPDVLDIWKNLRKKIGNWRKFKKIEKEFSK